MPEETVTHELAAIFYADVSGYSRLTQADEFGTHRQLSTTLDLISDRIICAGGKVVHYAGDAVLARFQSTVAATNCAIGIQSAIRALCADLDEDRRLLYRIGINLGEVIVDRNDIYGDEVNIAARLESLADPGGICISEAVFQQVRSKVEASFDDLGDQAVKNIDQPIRAFRIAPEPLSSDESAVALRIHQFSRIAGLQSDEALADVFIRSEAPSIVILPFKNLSGYADQDVLVDGFRLSIQSSLVKLPGLFLINAPAVEHYRGSDVSAIRAGIELGIRYVLEGAVQIFGERLRVTIQLTDAPAGRIVWAESYDRVFDDIFEIQDEVTTEVAVALDIKLLTGEEGLAWWKDLPSKTARELVLRGISHLYLGTESGNATARAIFQELMEILPDSPKAMALVAITYWLEVARDWSKDPRESIERAVPLAERSIELGDPDGFGHLILGSVRLHERKHAEALAMTGRAVSIRESCPLARAIYSNVLHFNGEQTQAIENLKRAVKRARIYPPWMAAVLSASYRDSGQIEPSIVVAHECLRIDPDNLDAQVVLCTDYSLSKRKNDAKKVAERILQLQPSFSISAYVETQPYKDKKTLDHIVDALREVGLPD